MRGRLIFGFLLGLWMPTVLAQTDAPPNLDQPLAPDELPAIEPPKPHQHGKLVVTFTGASTFNDRRLRDGISRQIATTEEFGLDDANAYDIAFFLESFYRRNGYSQASVHSTITGPWSLTLAINEGPLTRMGQITITGNKAYDTPTLDKYLLGPTRERFPRIRRDFLLPFVDADIQAGAGLIQRLYAAEGYLDAAVPAPTITFDSQHTVANIILPITEGIQYHFGDIRLEGPLIFSRDELLKEIANSTKTVFTMGRLAAAERALEDFYKDRGYFNADVTSEGDPANAVKGQVPVVFHIAPGALQRFDGVTVSGNSGVRSSFLQKRLQNLSGQVYSPGLVDQHFRELIETGLFRNVRITPTPIAGNRLRLDVNVEEAKPKEFGIGVGFATYDGAILSLNYTDLNLFGNGRPLSITTEITQRGYSGEVIYTDPWLFDSDYKLKLRLYAQTKDFVGYSDNEVGIQPTLSRKLGSHLELSTFVLAKSVKITNVMIKPDSLVGPTAYSLASIGVSGTLDYRNNATLPTSGYILTTTFDVAPNGVEDVAFARGVGRFTYYVPITTRSSLAFGARAGVLSPLNGNAIPIDERFFNGGATTVRSFSEYTLGPKDRAGYPLGGEGFTVFNVEYTFPIVGDLQGALFTDAGNVIQNASSFGIQNMRYGVGAGLRYNLPIGALRLDYGLNPAPKPGEAEGAFHFAIGVAF